MPLAALNKLTGTKIVYVSIAGEDVEKLIPAIKQLGFTVPYPRQSSFEAAFTEDGRLVGIIGLQFLPHVGPFYVDKEFRGTEVSQKLVERTAKLCEGNEFKYVLCVADNPVVQKFCRDHDWVETPGTIFVQKPKE